VSRRFTGEQAAAIADRRGSRLLAANAGSGKTAVMVERFVEAVVHDEVPVGGILALTFTEKAAGELRDRIRRRLVERGLHEESRAAEGAWLGTIHGFCARVLRTAPLAAGLDPGFAVLDEPAARRAADEAWAVAVEAWAEREGDPAIDLMAGAGIGLREVIAEAHAELRSRGVPVALPAVAPAPAPDREALEAARAEAASLLVTAGAGVRVEAARAALEACESVLAADGVPVAGLLDAAKMSNGAKVLGEAPCVAYRQTWTEFRKACADHHARAAMPLLDSLLREYDARYEAAKAARGGLDFDDLQLRVRDLFAADAGLRARWAERFALIMVDEFQDTNRLQLDILEQLERDNLFAVGDELQSIYGFRHADVTIFRDRAAALGPQGTRRLTANFRSEEELLDVLNGAFAPIFGGAFAPLRAGNPALRPAADGELRLFDPDRVGASGEPPVELLLTDTKAWDEDDDDGGALGAAIPGVPLWRRAEAVRVARRLRREVDGGRRPGDLVVLVRAAASLRLFEQALEEAGLPTYVVGGRGYWSQEQVRDGIAYLSALANPLDEAALLAVLASPFAGLGADALVAVARAGREAGGLWAAMRAGVAGVPGEETARVREFTAFFAAERDGAERRPVEVLLERAVARTGYDLATLSRPGGERRLANLRKLMRLAREYERSEGRDLRGFLAFVTEQDLVTAREGEAALESEGLDAVRLMTIHRAKGLEFPVVCVADLGRAGPGNRPRLLLARDGRAGLRLRALGEPAAVASLDWEALAAERDEAEAAEERRLLYVAMTRAEERLILSGGVDMTRWPASRPNGPPMDWIAPAMLGNPAAAVEGGVEIVDRPFQGRPARIALRLNRPADLAADVVPERRPASAGTALPAEAKVDPPPPHQPALAPMLRRLSYSSLGFYARCGYRFYLQRGLGLPDVAPPPGAVPAAAEGPGGLDPRVRGSLVHLLLESLDFRRPVPPTPAAVRAAAASMGAELSEEDVEDAAALVGAFAESELCGRLARAHAVRREAPFAFPLFGPPGAGGFDSPLLHGIVDVIGREADGAALVVDYKTDRLGEADPVEMADRAYGTQRAVYALAALREDVPRVDVAHCFLERPERTALATFTPADIPALEERLLGLAGGLLAGEFPVAAEPHRELCATCPGRRALCSHPEELTLREPEEALAGYGV
jgi:ATP-dependent exoDNAse (exonuclease V) beta subunit